MRKKKKVKRRRRRAKGSSVEMDRAARVPGGEEAAGWEEWWEEWC